MSEIKTPARIHAILPRKGNCGVVFRRGADYDSRHRRIVFAQNGALFSIQLKNINAEPVMLYDFNDMEYKEVSAPY